MGSREPADAQHPHGRACRVQPVREGMAHVPWFVPPLLLPQACYPMLIWMPQTLERRCCSPRLLKTAAAGCGWPRRCCRSTKRCAAGQAAVVVAVPRTSAVQALVRSAPVISADYASNRPVAGSASPRLGRKQHQRRRLSLRLACFLVQSPTRQVTMMMTTKTTCRQTGSWTE